MAERACDLGFGLNIMTGESQGMEFAVVQVAGSDTPGRSNTES